MKLTFFEKELFDNDAFEKPTISINSQDATQRELVKKIATPLSDGAFVSGEKNKAIRTIKIPAEYLDFFKDGTKFTGTFKHTKLTSGEPEIVSRTTAPQVTKPINVSFNVNANFERETTTVTTPGVGRQGVNATVASILYEPILNFLLGGSVSVQIANGFVNSFVRIHSAVSSALRASSLYSTFIRFLRGVYNTGWFNSSGALVGPLSRLDWNEAQIEMPQEIIRKTTVTPLPNRVYRITGNFLYPYQEFGGLYWQNETQYWRITGNVENVFSVKDYSMNGSSVNARLVLPTVQSIKYSDDTRVEWVNRNGSRRTDPRSESLLAIYPQSVSRSDFSYRINSRFSSTTRSRTQRFEGGGSHTSTYEAYLYISRFEITLNGYNGFFNSLPVGYGFPSNFGVTFNNGSGNYGGENYSQSFNILGSRFTLRVSAGTGSYGKNKYVSDVFSRSVVSEGRFIAPNNPTDNRRRTTQSDLDNEQEADIERVIQGFISQINGLNNQRANNVHLLDIRNNRRPESIRPLLNSDFSNQTGIVRKADLGISGSSIIVNGIRLSGSIPDSLSTLSVPRGSIQTISTYDVINNLTYILGAFKAFYYVVASGINVGSLPMISRNNLENNTSPASTELRQSLPINLPTISGTNSYSIISIDFARNYIYITKNNGTAYITGNELRSIGIVRGTGSVREVNLGSGSRTTLGGLRVNRYVSSAIADLFKPSFQRTIRGRRINGVVIPNFSSFLTYSSRSIQNVINVFRTLPKSLRFLSSIRDVRSPTTRRIFKNLFENADETFPHIQLNDLLYRNGQIKLVITRGTENAPVPSKDYFDSVLINNRSFNFKDSTYEAYNDPDSSPYNVKASEYSWNYATNILDSNIIPISLKKSGNSVTDAFDISRLVRKSTVNTRDKKNYTDIIASLFVKDIGFTSTSFYIEFSGEIPATNFQSIALKSEDGADYITRQLLTANATRVQSGGTTKFTWENEEEFAILAYNKTYQIEIIKGANQTEKRLFVPIQSKQNFHFLKDYKQTAGSIEFSLQRNGSVPRISFISQALLDRSNRVISNAWHNLQSFTAQSDDNGGSYAFKNAQIPDSPASGTKVYVAFQVEDRPTTEITTLKLTDQYADTFVLLDTNADDLNPYDTAGNPLAHPSDYEEIKAVEEGELRHLVVKLKQPITAPQVNWVIRRTSDNANKVRIGRMLILKKIGEFSQFPAVTVNTNTNKTDSTSAINTSHITTKPLSINYNFSFPPLTKLTDLALAQDIFSRASEYNEFIVWLSGGDIAPKIPNLLGYRFIDFVKSLSVNDFSISYADDRFSSGVNFTLATKQVSRINI